MNSDTKQSKSKKNLTSMINKHNAKQKNVNELVVEEGEKVTSRSNNINEASPFKNR